MSEFARVASTGWSALADELDRWRAAGRSATLWWRDDDAVAPSAPLDRLLAIAGDVPVALAVIPGRAEPRLKARLAQHSRSELAVLQHGWRHLNHSSAGKKSEFPAERSRHEGARELAAGRARVAELFGPMALPVLVPPWNRLAASFLPLLRDLGICAISRVKPRVSIRPAVGLIEANVHIDLVAWTGDRGFIGEGAALGGLVRHLRARRLGEACAEEPTGILTHHLVQDEATDVFLGRLLATTRAHAAACWLGARDVFSCALAVDR